MLHIHAFDLYLDFVRLYISMLKHLSKWTTVGDPEVQETGHRATLATELTRCIT